MKVRMLEARRLRKREKKKTEEDRRIQASPHKVGSAPTNKDVGTLSREVVGSTRRCRKLQRLGWLEERRAEVDQSRGTSGSKVVWKRRSPEETNDTAEAATRSGPRTQTSNTSDACFYSV